MFPWLFQRAWLSWTVQLTGASYFSLGLTLAICLFPPSLAITSILHLVLGDMMAALIGVSFGGDVCVVKLGRTGKKSVEGSVAMFLTCFLITITVSRLRVCVCVWMAVIYLLNVRGRRSLAGFISSSIRLLRRRLRPPSLSSIQKNSCISTTSWRVCWMGAFRGTLNFFSVRSLTIPLISCLAMTWAFSRTADCFPCP
jgi:hypothetical protein